MNLVMWGLCLTFNYEKGQTDKQNPYGYVVRQTITFDGQVGCNHIWIKSISLLIILASLFSLMCGLKYSFIQSGNLGGSSTLCIVY